MEEKRKMLLKMLMLVQMQAEMQNLVEQNLQRTAQARLVQAEIVPQKGVRAKGQDLQKLANKQEKFENDTEKPFFLNGFFIYFHFFISKN